MYIGEAGQVRHLPIVLSAANFYRVAVALKNAGQLQLGGAAFSLRTFLRMHQLLFQTVAPWTEWTKWTEYRERA